MENLTDFFDGDGDGDDGDNDSDDDSEDEPEAKDTDGDDDEKEDDVPPPSVEDLKAAAMADSDNEVIEAAARAAEVDGGGWKSGAAEDQYSEPETFDYMFDPNERVNGAWDTFDEADELMRQQEEEEEAKAEEAERTNRKTTKK